MTAAELLRANARSLVERPFGDADPAELAARFDEALGGLARRRGVSVVVPIRDAGASVERCVDALLASRTRAQIVLVDDHSTDPVVERACRRLLAEHENAKLVRNERTAGFVASVNIGIRASDADRDVVLLNSDTQVAPGWLDKLSLAAYSAPRVASASPLSNAAGIFSLPVEHRDNELPDGWDPRLCDRVLEEVSWREYERMPATSGFCLYVRREALDEVGLFDELLFLRGYGEENDFCARASEQGFVHVLDDATFVFHERAASFGGTKSVLKRRNARVLKALHPGHQKDQQAWEAESRLGLTRERYDAVLRELRARPVDEVRAAAEALLTTLVIARGGAPAGEWTAASRSAVVRLGSEIELDVFGLGTARFRPPGDRPLGLLWWLSNRLGARRVRVAPGALDANEAARLHAALPLVDWHDPVEAVR
ncbi:MAG TPA: glycosyltransferase [Solirubrobacteraceae bacterium]|nr:glycosyltransferase [Solirubrobacteraceae bacterium]